MLGLAFKAASASLYLVELVRSPQNGILETSSHTSPAPLLKLPDPQFHGKTPDASFPACVPAIYNVSPFV